MTFTWLLAVLIPQIVPGTLLLEGTQVFVRNPSSLEHILVAIATLGCYLLLFGRHRRPSQVAHEHTSVTEAEIARDDSDNVAA